ncbi:hypothetical protein [Corynebacterium glucuronolyticum]|nr:hypothetical protein [Corynebacterium glucuronolyticum]
MAGRDVLRMMSVAAAGGEPLLERHYEGWRLGDGARDLFGARLSYLRLATFEALTGLKTFLSEFRTINCDDLVALQGGGEQESEDILRELVIGGRLEENAPGEVTLVREQRM